MWLLLKPPHAGRPEDIIVFQVNVLKMKVVFVVSEWKQKRCVNEGHKYKTCPEKKHVVTRR